MSTKSAEPSCAISLTGGVSDSTRLQPHLIALSID